MMQHNPVSYVVYKTTLEKLQHTLNDINWTVDGAELVKVEWVGGRDWVVVAKWMP